MADYIPAQNAESDGWQDNWVTFAVANLVALGLDPPVDIPAILAVRSAWNTHYDGHLTASAAVTAPTTAPTPVPAPTTAPVLNVAMPERLRHVVEVSKTALEGGGLAKPAGVRGVQLWRKIGDPAPASESDLQFVSELTRTRMTLDYQMTEGGQTVYYQARWVSARGDTGRWGELVSATVVK